MPARKRGEPPGAAAGSVPDCVRCGACCFTTDPRYVEVFDVDWARMGARARSLVDELTEPGEDGAPRVRRFMRILDGRCAALGLDPDRGRYPCSIYEERSDVCRHSLEAGWGHCHEQRAAKLPIAEEALRRSARRG